METYPFLSGVTLFNFIDTKQMKEIHFYKMQGAGNDFVVFDNRDYHFTLDEIIKLTPKLCHRKLGIGADGTLILGTSDIADFTMIYRNADGSDAGMCGNGGRCIARFAHIQGFPSNHTFSVHENVYNAHVSDDSVTLEFPVKSLVEECDTTDGEKVLKIHTGTEHVVVPSNGYNLNDDGNLRSRGKIIRRDTPFQPKGTNVNFMQGLSGDRLRIVTYERGVEDLTLACGTGAIASALAWHHQQNKQDLENSYFVDNPGGQLEVSFHFDPSEKTYDHIQLKGPAQIVFEGVYRF